MDQWQSSDGIHSHGKGVKQEHLPLATGVQITVEGRRYLGTALGTGSFTEAYVKEQVQEWVGEIARLSSIGSSPPHAAYAALSHGLFSKWTYLMRTQPDISDLLKPPKEAIHHSLIPALTGRHNNIRDYSKTVN